MTGSKMDLAKLDLYGLLEIEFEASITEIKKAYRKKALSVHPDKNPDNPKAAELFHQLSKALEILTDEGTRAAYDRIQKAKKVHDERNKLMDSKRRKLKDDLEARERRAASKTEDMLSDEERLRREIERLRKEGSKQLQEEQERIRNLLQKEREEALKNIANPVARLKVSWTADKADSTNGTYNAEVLRRILGKYGTITGLIVSSKKNGSALVEFSRPADAEKAVMLEKGLPNCPLTLQWLSGAPVKTSPATFSPTATSGHPMDLDAMEAIVLGRLRQAEERKRQMLKVNTESANAPPE